jgi:hypothetical protein
MATEYDKDVKKGQTRQEWKSPRWTANVTKPNKVLKDRFKSKNQAENETRRRHIQS